MIVAHVSRAANVRRPATAGAIRGTQASGTMQAWRGASRGTPMSCVSHAEPRPCQRVHWCGRHAWRTMCAKIRATWLCFLAFICWYLLHLNFDFESIYDIGKLSTSSSHLGENRNPKLVSKAILWRDKILILFDPLRKDYGESRKKIREKRKERKSS